jgi:hypothetical protein
VKNVSKIKSKIEALKAQLHEAEAAERERKSARVARAAERAGLLDLAVEPAVLEREFRALAERLTTVAESSDTAKPETQTPTPATEAVAVPETAATVADQTTGGEEKSDKKRWGWK